MALSLVRAESPEHRKAAVELEAQVFLQWFGNTEEQLADEYGPYEEPSVFFAVIDDETGCAAGMMRILRPSPIGFKTVHDLAGEPWHADVEAALTGIDLERTCDIATLGVADDFRRANGGEVALAVYHGLYRWSLASGVDHWIGVNDTRVLVGLQAMNLDFAPLPGTAPGYYLGSESSVPFHATPHGCAEGLRATPALYERLVLGRFDDITTPDDDYWSATAE